MAKAVGVLARERGRSGRTSPCARGARSRCSTWLSPFGESEGPRRGGRYDTSTEPHSSKARSGASSWSSLAARRAWIVGGISNCSPAESRRGQASLKKQGVAFPAWTIRPCSSFRAAQVAQQLLALGCVERAPAGSWSRVHCRQPRMVCALAAPAGPCTAAGWAHLRRSRTCSARSSRTSSPECRSSKTQTNGRCCASCSSRRKPQASPPRSPAHPSAEQRAQRPGRIALRQRPELLETSTTGQ